MHGLPFKGIQVSTRRADKRWLRRSLVASRGSWGSALPWISKVADRGLVWPLLGGALAARPIHSQRRRSRDSRRCRHQRRHVGHPAGGPAGPATHVNRTAHPRVGQTAGRIILPVNPRGERLRLHCGRWHDLPRAQRCPGAIGGGDRRRPRRDRPPLSRDVVAGALTGAGIGTAIGLFVRRRYPRSSPPESPLSPLPRTGLSVADPRGRDPRPPAAYDERTDKDRTRLDAG